MTPRIEGAPGTGPKHKRRNLERERVVLGTEELSGRMWSGVSSTSTDGGRVVAYKAT